MSEGWVGYRVGGDGWVSVLGGLCGALLKVSLGELLTTGNDRNKNVSRMN